MGAGLEELVLLDAAELPTSPARLATPEASTWEFQGCCSHTPERATLLHTLCPRGTGTHCPWQAGQRLSLEQLGWVWCLQENPMDNATPEGLVLLMVPHWHCHHACHSKDVDVRVALALGP